jgi:hypothetical protein
MLNCLAVLTVLVPANAHGLTWHLDSKDEVTHAPHVVNPKTMDGLFRGTTAWDPYVFFALPKGGIDGHSLTRPTVRLYSSTPADHIAVYYKCDDERWALGTSHPVVRGLAEYRIDLTQLRYHGDVSPLEGSRQWGGPSGRITIFRIDPGNQAGRWIAIDEVRLEPVDEESFEPGVTRLSTEGGRLATVTVPESVDAGDERVTAELPILNTFEHSTWHGDWRAAFDYVSDGDGKWLPLGKELGWGGYGDPPHVDAARGSQVK